MPVHNELQVQLLSIEACERTCVFVPVCGVCVCVDLRGGGVECTCRHGLPTSVCVCLSEDLAAAYFLLSSTVKSTGGAFHLSSATLHNPRHCRQCLEEKSSGRESER